MGLFHLAHIFERSRTSVGAYKVHVYARAYVYGLNKILFIHRNHKLNKYVQETQKQYAYLSVTYR